MGAGMDTDTGPTTSSDVVTEGPEGSAGTTSAATAVARGSRGRTARRSILSHAAARAAAVLVLVLVAGVVAVTLVNQSFFGPHRPVEAYLDDLVAGDAGTSRALVRADDGGGGAALLADAVYGAAQGRVSGYAVRDVVVDGGAATVVADLTQDGTTATREFTLTRTGSTALVFDAWRLDGPAPVSDVGVVVPQDLEAITVNGADVELPAGGAGPYPGRRSLALPALPGTYVVSPPAPSTYLSYGDPQSIEVPADPAAAPSGVLIDAAPTAAAEAEAVARVTAWLDACTASTDAAPSGCPNRSFVFGNPEDVRGPRWTLDRAPTFTLEQSYEPGVYRLLSDDAVATFSYERNAEFEDLLPPRWEREQDTQTLSISATVTVTGEAIEVAPD